MIKKVRNQHYYLNFKNKKISDPSTHSIFREKNLNLLHKNVYGLKIFSKIIKVYNIIEKGEKLKKLLLMKIKRILIK